MIGGRKTRSNKGKKRTPYGPRTGVTRSKTRFRELNLTKNNKTVFTNNVNNVNNVNNNASIIKPGTYVRPTFNTINKINKPKRRKVRSNKGKKRTPYGPRTGVTRSKQRFR